MTLKSVYNKPKNSYFTTADGVSVKADDPVFYIGVLCSNKRAVFMDRCKVAIRTNMMKGVLYIERGIFSNREAALSSINSI